MHLKPALLGALLASAAIAPAAAQDHDDPDDEEGMEIVLGLGAGSKPDYLGSDDSEVRALPFVRVEGERFYMHGPTLGYNVIAGDSFSLGVVARYQVYGERKADDNPALRGLEDIDAGLDAGLSASYENSGWFTELSLYKDVSDTHDGSQADFEIGREFQLGERAHVELAATATWADDKYMQTYFGITPAQSAASGLRAYQAGSGLKSFGLDMGLSHALNENWLLHSRVNVQKLRGDAVDSPLVKDLGSDLQTGVSLFVGYRF